MEHNRKHNREHNGSKPTYTCRWSVNIWQGNQEYAMEKIITSINNPGKIAYLHEKYCN